MLARVKKYENTYESVDRAWDNFDGIATALTDSLSDYIGGPIFLVAVAPVGNDNGEINVRMQVILPNCQCN
jgi:hypothetical protein